ncbi:hypothetical protein TRFO_31393 [Tritrichomonas foetus]|uniref:Uncharacterized protein n=1 Tax=Tritrichomonas foetus TaxID=1144522 RepID=A0A1J4JTE5_9EUKA|nr:hypothetical protein TRFO_31393 [Tritrichomonas foetus]|eukprot:OHT01696.1 hypothetical protein TRFO_31393 [Tritrichomonas foetus]
MNISPEVLDIIHQICPNTENLDINEKIKFVCNDLISATDMVQSMLQIAENNAKAQKDFQEIISRYGVITSSALNDLSKMQESGLQNNLTNNQIFDLLNSLKTELSKNNENIQSRFLDFAFSTTNSVNQQIEKIENLRKKVTVLPKPEKKEVHEKNDRIIDEEEKIRNNQAHSILTELSNKLNCKEIINLPLAVSNLFDDNKKYFQCLTTIVEHLKCENDQILQTIDDLMNKKSLFHQIISKLDCTENNFNEKINNLYNSEGHLNEIASLLDTDSSNVLNSLTELVNKVKISINETDEIESLKGENEQLKRAKQQLVDERDSLLQRVAELQPLTKNRNKTPELSYKRYDFLASFPPKENFENQIESEYEELLRSKNETITSLNYQLQNLLGSMQELRKIKENEISALNDRILEIELTKDRKDNKCRELEKEVKELQETIESSPQSQTIHYICSLLRCNEREIPNILFEMKEKILLLSTKESPKQNKIELSPIQNQNSNSKQISELKTRIAEATNQITSLQQNITSLKSDNMRVTQDNNNLYRQIQKFRDDAATMKEEISNKQRDIRESKRSYEKLQRDYDALSLENKKLSDEDQVFVKEINNIISKVNRFSNNHQGSSEICDALQSVLIQFTIHCKFNNDATDKLLQALQSSKGRSLSHDDMNHIQNRAFTSFQNIQSIFDKTNHNVSELSKKIERVLEFFEKTKQNILLLINDQKEELDDFRENDYAVPYASLLTAHNKLKEDYDRMMNTKNKSRFQATPPKKSSLHSVSFNSPSSVVLNDIIAQNRQQYK